MAPLILLAYVFYFWTLKEFKSYSSGILEMGTSKISSQSITVNKKPEYIPILTPHPPSPFEMQQLPIATKLTRLTDTLNEGFKRRILVFVSD